MWKTELKYGIIGGLILCGFKYVEYLPVFQAVRVDSGIYTNLLAFVIVIAVIIMGVKAKPYEDEDSPFTFQQAFRTGMVIAILMAIIVTPFMYIYARFINPLEAYDMLRYLSANREDGLPMSPKEIHAVLDYYKASNRAIHTFEDIIVSGIVVSLFSAGMFRRKISINELDLVKKRKIPSTLKKAFYLSIILTLFTMLVYVAWILKYEEVSSYLYDYLVDPINPFILQAGTAVLALSSLVLNIVYFNRIAHYRRSVNIWNVLMIVICGLLFFILLWPIL